MAAWDEYSYLSLLSHQLEHNEVSFNSYRKALGQTIKSLTCDYQTLTILFENGFGIAITDTGQMCCEHRYMVCDDDTREYLGATLLGMELSGPMIRENDFKENDREELDEIQFLRIHTSRGTLVVSSHIDGRYSGFSLMIQPIEPLWPVQKENTSEKSKAPDPGGEG